MAVGRFITFEGGEGAGKSTQVQHLAAKLKNSGLNVLTTREPGGSPGAEAIRKLLLGGTADWDPKTEALLHFTARRDHALKTILPALKRGDWVLCDRFSDSTVAYQGHGHGLVSTIISQISQLTLGDLGPPGLVPDLTIILDLDVRTGLERAKGRGQGLDHYESLDLDFHNRLRQAFLDIARQEPERCFVFDATAPEEAISEEVTKLVGRQLGVNLT
ncbi:MAG: dTMP kinase [Pseudomonadota bacterium]